MIQVFILSVLPATQGQLTISAPTVLLWQQFAVDLSLDPSLGIYGQHLTHQTHLKINEFLNHLGISEIPVLIVSALFIILDVLDD